MESLVAHDNAARAMLLKLDGESTTPASRELLEACWGCKAWESQQLGGSPPLYFSSQGVRFWCHELYLYNILVVRDTARIACP
jgi:hypothetical protein